MPFENVNSISMTPSSAAIAQGRFLEMANAGEVSQANAATDDPVGISLESSALDSTVAIAVAKLENGSKIELEAGAAIDVSSSVVAISSDSSGRAITAASGSPVLGYALQSASVAGEFITVLISKAARQV